MSGPVTPRTKATPGLAARVCRKCGVEKPLIAFTKNKRCTDGVTHQCKVCTQPKYRQFAIERRHDERFIEARRLSQKKHRAKKYGLTLDQLDALYERARNVCEVCESSPTKTGTSSNDLHVDHCHETGRVRGLLCSRCNTAIGLLSESATLLDRAKEYLCRT